MKQKSWLPLKGSLSGKSKILFYLSLSVLIFSCHKEKFKWKTKTKNDLEFLHEKDSVLILEGVSSDPRFGYTSKKPIKLGVQKLSIALTYPQKYFNSITGPNGEKIHFERVKSCCPFKTVNSDQYEFKNVAVLEIYAVTYEGLASPVYLYINFFDQGKVMAPKGFLPKITNE